MQPLCDDAQALLLAERLRTLLFKVTKRDTQWVNTTGGYQYQIHTQHGETASPAAAAITQLLEIMFDWNLEAYIKPVIQEWNAAYAPGHKDNEDNRILFDYNKEALHAGQAQRKAAQRAARATAQQDQRTEAARPIFERILSAGLDALFGSAVNVCDPCPQNNGRCGSSCNRTAALIGTGIIHYGAGGAG